MDAQGWAVVIGAVSTIIPVILLVVKSASTSYRDSVDRRAGEIENKRLADAATTAVNAKNAEIIDLRTENTRLWRMYEQCDQMVRRLPGNAAMENGS